MNSAAVVLYFQSLAVGSAPTVDECRHIQARYPARGGKDARSDIRCHHGWPAHRNGNNSHGCRGWVPGKKTRRPDDGLDCRFYLALGGVWSLFLLVVAANDYVEVMDFNINACWDKSTTWGVDQPSAERVIERRQYRMSVSAGGPDPGPIIVEELRNQCKRLSSVVDCSLHVELTGIPAPVQGNVERYIAGAGRATVMPVTPKKTKLS